MSNPKETDFFIDEKNYTKGIDWYKNRFIKNDNDIKAVGEASPNYSKRHLFNGVPERISRLIPKCKIIYIVRDPVERILSHYKHNYAHGRESKSFYEAIQGRDNPYILTSKYYFQLEAFRQYFIDENILLIKSEHLKRNTTSTLNKIYSFIDVPPFHSKNFDKKYNTAHTKSKRRPIYRQHLDSLIQPLFKNKYSSMLLRPILSSDKTKYAIRRTAKALLPSSITEPTDYETPTLKPEHKKMIINLIEDDIKQLSNICEFNLSDWQL